MLIQWSISLEQFLPELLELIDYSVSEILCKFYYVTGEAKSNFGKNSNLKSIYTSAWLSGRHKNTENDTPCIYKFTLKMLNRVSKSQMDITLPPSNLLVSTPMSNFLFFPPFSLLHSSFPSPTFIPFWPSFCHSSLPKPPPTAFSLTESHLRCLIFFVSSVISRGGSDSCPPSSCAPVQLLSGNRALFCLQWELREN